MGYNQRINQLNNQRTNQLNNQLVNQHHQVTIYISYTSLVITAAGFSIFEPCQAEGPVSRATSVAMVSPWLSQQLEFPE